MYRSGKIGVFISHIMGHYQKNVCQGIIDKSLEYGYTTEIFTTMDGENLGDYGIGERSILDIPHYENYSGIIFASDTYPAAEFRQQICASLQKKCRCPIVEIAVTDQHFPAIVLENNSMTAELVTHLACVHGHRRICYLGCSAQPYSSDSREAFYRTAMEDAALSVAPSDVYACKPKAASLGKALEHFLSPGEPDAIVCYNDEMALLLMQEMTKHGYRIPEDIAVTGCDNLAEGQHILPTLTSVTFPVYDLGSCAVETLIRQMRGESVCAVTPVAAATAYGTSCGCPGKEQIDILSFQQSLRRRIASLETSMLGSMHMSAAFSGITDIDDGMELLADYVRNIEHCSEFYLCLYEGWDSVSKHIRGLMQQEEGTPDSDTVLLKLALRNGKRLPECSFKRTATHGLLPEHLDKQSHSTYICTPLFFKDKAFGYVALACEGNRIDYHFQLVHWFMNINHMLHSICETKCTSLLVQHLEDVHEKDMLTGLYNRQGYMQRAKAFLTAAADLEESILCFSLRLLHLRDINTSYGCTDGDFAIQVIGQALSSVTSSPHICARLGSGDFCVLVSCPQPGCAQKNADDLLAHVNAYLNHYNRLSTKPYVISVSCGYICTKAVPPQDSFDIDTLFAAAEENRRAQPHT